MSDDYGYFDPEGQPMTDTTITISPADIREGDFLLREDGTAAWVALADATTVNRLTPRAGVRVAVEPADGGPGYRFWPSTTAVRFAIVDDLGVRRLRMVVREGLT